MPRNGKPARRKRALLLRFHPIPGVMPIPASFML
jgi:hypothetical protein